LFCNGLSDWVNQDLLSPVRPNLFNRNLADRIFLEEKKTH